MKMNYQIVYQTYPYMIGNEKKGSNEKKIIKARLCARGFKQEQNFITDSLTCSREGLQLSCCVMSANQWTLNSLDAYM